MVIFWSYTNAESNIYVQKLIKNDTKVYMLSNRGHKVPTKKLPPFTSNNTHWNREIITSMSSMAFLWGFITDIFGNILKDSDPVFYQAEEDIHFKFHIYLILLYLYFFQVQS